LELLIRKLQVADELFYRHYEGDLYKNVALLKKIIKSTNCIVHNDLRTKGFLHCLNNSSVLIRFLSKNTDSTDVE